MVFINTIINVRGRAPANPETVEQYGSWRVTGDAMGRWLSGRGEAMVNGLVINCYSF